MRWIILREGFRKSDQFLFRKESGVGFCAVNLLWFVKFFNSLSSQTDSSRVTCSHDLGFAIFL